MDDSEDGRSFLKDLMRSRVDFSRTDQARDLPAPPLQKPCPPELPRIDLPDGRQCLASLARMPVGDAIPRRESVRHFAETPVTLEELSALLWATQGVRRVINDACALRSVPSAGARHAFETCLAVARVESLVPGLYRYLPFDVRGDGVRGRLALLAEDPSIGLKTAAACLGQRFVARAAVTFLWTVIPARMEWRYAAAAHKVIAIDAGHLCQNLYLACEAVGAGTCAIAAYDQDACDSLLGVDGSDEFTVYIAPVGKRT